MKYYHFLVALFTTVMLFIPSCDPNYTGFWYIENQLDEDIIVTRSDSTEIHNFRLHPENQQDLLNKRFWDFDYWQSLIDHENRTQTLLFILENSYNE